MKSRLLFTLCALPLATSQAALTTYTPDANTRYLYHFDEAAGASSAANAGSAGFSAIAYDGNPSVPGTPIANVNNPQPSNTTILGATGFTGFGNAANVSAADLGLGVDGNNSGTFQAGNSNANNSPDAVLQSSFSNLAGSFTIDAMINVPSISLVREIVSTDNTAPAGSPRGFQFRTSATGTLDFNFIGTGGAPVTAAIPTVGANAFVANEWFHVAFTYDAPTTTTRLYWTRVDPANTIANQIGTGTTETTLNTLSSSLVIGNENRGVANEGLLGLIDEVRISDTVRGAGDFIFVAVPEPSTALLGGIGLLALLRRRRA
jgi:hypothetical protein